MGLFKKIKKAASSAVKSVGNAGHNVAKATGDAAKDVAAVASAAATGGAYSTDGKSGWAQGNSYAGGMSKALGVEDTKRLGMSAAGALSPEAPSLDEGSMTFDEEEDETLSEEVKNARKKGRASTILGGVNDSGSTSSRRALMGA